MELLDKAKELRQARQAERLAAVEDLARRQAIGEPISPEDLVEACELAGVDLEKDFPDRVAHRLKRIGLRAAVAQRAEAQQQRDQAEAAMAAALAKLEAAQSLYNQENPPAWNALQEASQRLSAADTAERELERGCKNRGILDQFAKINQEHGVSRNRLAQLTNRQRELIPIIAGHQSSLAKFQEIRILHPSRQYFAGQITRGDMSHEDAQRIQAALITCQTEHDRNVEELAVLEPRVAELQRQEQDLRRQAVESEV